ncbi:MAG: HAMP domain-containing histidine kinase [Oscillospiraceae bacterium]|nr:HAMP domain-containing histidine kinase [Oscillospiraceae bacterium]
MKKLITAAVTAVLLLIVIMGAAWNDRGMDDISGMAAVSLNEIERLCEQGDTESARQAANTLRKELAAHEKESDHTLPLMCGVCIVFLAGACAYLIKVIIIPFNRLSTFAEKVAAGDLSEPLRYDREDIFGKFVWAFDSMRNEIIRSRACEREAMDSNKTVIASLSHDIKTPIASVKAYAEALDMGLDSSEETRRKYIAVMIRKCDEITKITDDMLTHSLTELNRLRMSPERFELISFLERTAQGLSADNSVHFERPSYSLYVYADMGRTAQIAENLISNARKYAGSCVDISVDRTESTAQIHFRDYGTGIPDEDMPFITDKFYRGKNSSSTEGTGLGLYIVKYIVTQSGGSLRLINHDDGLEVIVSLPLDKEQ